MAENKSLDEILEEEAKKLDEIAQRLGAEKIEEGDADEGVEKLIVNYEDLTEGEKRDLARKFAQLDPLSRERNINSLALVEQANLKKIMEGVDVPVCSARVVSIVDLRSKILGEMKTSSPPDLEQKVEERTRAFVQRGVHFLVQLVGEGTARKWGKAMQGEGF